MNRNHLKLIACAAMLCDHIGYLLLPQFAFLRYIGRLAMPLFAFFIGEGCRYTHNRKKYALQLGVLAAVCQAAYFVEELLGGGGLSAESDCWYFNILFTFVLACGACFLWLDGAAFFTQGEKKKAVQRFVLLAAYLAALALLTWFAWRKRRLDGWSLYVDYGFCGILLPLSVVLFRKKRKKLLSFTGALLIYCAVFTWGMPYVWCSLLCVPLLALYNGHGGSKRFKYLFYVFYPAHLAILYLISQFF